MPADAKQRVVVADDSRLMRRMLADALDRQGFDVVATAAAGGRILAEAEETCTIFGMPRAVAGLADHVLPLGELGAAIAREVDVT